MTALHDLSAHELGTAFRNRSLSPVEATQAVIAHIQRWEPRLGALWAFDPDTALEMARASEARWQRGEPLSALDGVPVTIKENIATRGLPMPLGTAATELVPAADDAPPAARLREAGCVFVARTTMPDYGMLSSGLSSFHQLARNPWNLDKNPGGSSAGAGAAAAAGYGPLHVGTDIGGSVRLPAGWCGIFGLKPSNGRVPIKPPFIGRVAGPMTRTVTDAALMMQALSQPDWRDTTSLPPQAIDWLALDGLPLKGLRLGLQLDAGWGIPTAPDVAATVSAAARLFEAAGAIVEPLATFTRPEVAAGIDLFWRVRSWLDINALPAARRDKVLPYIRAWAEGGAHASTADVFHGFLQIGVLREAAVAACQPFDFVLSPVSPVPSYAADWASPLNDPARAMDHIGYTVPFNMSEQPSASINAGYTADGLPIGLQITGRRHDDLGVLRLARAFEQLRPAQRAWPQPPG
ncbi:amidase [Pseudorhodoferax sp.]|uniref:amidase n=1 Tax=Pseudorhodoferax sp. TaxID=1993553 RepID=UPI002DD62BF9|nr:amidase [Pseudorhodoferax sp.]